jgi:4-carboxymuconolactone decarboxylase
MFAVVAIPYDVASALISHGVLPELNNRQAIRRFTARRNLSYLIGLYCLVSVTFNGFDVQVPEPDAT